MANGGETKVYSFTATAGQVVYFNDLSLSKGTDRLSVRLIDPLGNQVYGIASFDDSGRLTLATAGTYTLLLEGRTWDQNPVTYSFALDNVVDQAVALTLGTNPAPGPLWTAGKFGKARCNSPARTSSRCRTARRWT